MGNVVELETENQTVCDANSIHLSPEPACSSWSASPCSPASICRYEQYRVRKLGSTGDNAGPGLWRGEGHTGSLQVHDVQEKTSIVGFHSSHSPHVGGVGLRGEIDGNQPFLALESGLAVEQRKIQWRLLIRRF